TNSSPGRARYKPLKPLRREGRIVSVNLWRRRSCAVLFACEAAGATSTWLSLRPLYFLGRTICRTRARSAPRECGPALSPRCLKFESGNAWFAIALGLLGFVMPGLVPGIFAQALKTGMAGTKPGHDEKGE